MSAGLAVDLGTEVGEGFYLPPAGLPLEVWRTVVRPADGRSFHARHLAERFDDEVLSVVSSAHVACGLHSGDPVVIGRCVAKLVELGVQVGAHPSYPDVLDFGQGRVPLDDPDLEAVVLYQLGALQGVLTSLGERVRHVKCHGALAFDVAYDERVCAAFLRAMRVFDPSLILVAMAGSPSVEQARAAGLRVVEEGFADRGYDARGRLVPRDHPKALLGAPEDAVSQVLGMVRDGCIADVDGEPVALSARSICLHSDTPAAAEFGRAIVAGLRAAGVRVAPLAELAA